LLRGPLADRLLRHALLRHPWLTGPTANVWWLRNLRGRWRLSPGIHGRLLRRLHRPAALLRHDLLRYALLWRHTGLTRPSADRRRLLRLARLRVLLSPGTCRRLWNLGLPRPDARHLLWHALLRLEARMRVRLHRTRLNRARLRPAWLLRHRGLLRRSRLAGPASLLWRSEGDDAKQPDRLPSALRTTEGLRGPLNLKAAVRTAEGVH
jgi:hypothetical protein